MHAGAVHPSQGHTVAAVDVPHQAVADRQVDLGIRRADGKPLALGVQSEQLPVGAAERAIAVAVADLPIPLGGVAGGDEQVGLVVVERFHQRFGGVGGANVGAGFNVWASIARYCREQSDYGWLGRGVVHAAIDAVRR